MRKTLTPGFLDMFHSKFDVLLHCETLDFAQDITFLSDKLSNIQQPIKPEQRIIISHIDTDFYDKDILKYGMTLYNLITCFRKHHISLDFLVIVTNHFGIKKELKDLLNEDETMPTVIETFSSVVFYKPYGSYTKYPLNANKIEKNCICMMGGSERSHRFALYNFLQDEGLLDKVAISI